MPAPDGGDDFIRIGGPDEWLWAFVVLGKEAVDGGLEVNKRVEDAAFEAGNLPRCFHIEPYSTWNLTQLIDAKLPAFS